MDSEYEHLLVDGALTMQLHQLEPAHRLRRRSFGAVTLTRDQGLAKISAVRSAAVSRSRILRRQKPTTTER